MTEPAVVRPHRVGLRPRLRPGRAGRRAAHRGGHAARAPVLVGASMGGVTLLVAEGEHPGLCRGPVLVDIVPRVEPDGVRRITDFMTDRPEGFTSLEEVAQAVADYNPHRRDAARRVGVPTMLVRGVHSDILSDEGVDELLELIPGARYVDVGGTGHMVAGEDNDVFAASLTGFIDRL